MVLLRKTKIEASIHNTYDEEVMKKIHELEEEILKNQSWGSYLTSPHPMPPTPPPRGGMVARRG